jgi:hypothetical protein
MTTETADRHADPTRFDEATILDDIRGTRDALSVRRVFGDPCTVDGITVIPVARVAGGAGGGGGGGTDTPDREGHGFGTGFGLGVRPLGVYEVRGGHLHWKPAIDVDRLARGAQVLVAIAIICGAIVVGRRSS